MHAAATHVHCTLPCVTRASPQVQMTLTWANLVHHAMLGGGGSASGSGSGAAGGSSGPAGGGGGGGAGASGAGGGGAGGGAAAAQPLLSGKPDSLARLGAIIGAMMGDVLGRVLLDRWAARLWHGGVADGGLAPFLRRAERWRLALATAPRLHAVQVLAAPNLTHRPPRAAPAGTRRTDGRASLGCGSRWPRPARAASRPRQRPAPSPRPACCCKRMLDPRGMRVVMAAAAAAAVVVGLARAAAAVVVVPVAQAAAAAGRRSTSAARSGRSRFRCRPRCGTRRTRPRWRSRR